MDAAQQPGAPDDLKSDVAELLKWMKVPDLATWHSMTLDQQRQGHEAFARGFEKRLMTGRSPSLKLDRMFRTFRAWLVSIYRTMRNLKVNVTPEVRSVMDRMIATDAEIAEAAELGVHVAHCPESNLKLASGFCPVARLLKAGVNVCLGTDGAASNNDLDLFGELKTAALLAKAVAGDATALGAPQALHMATLAGAKALMLDDQIGSLVPGKQADFIAVDLAALNTQPVYGVLSHLAYAVNSRQVSDVFVAGKRLLQSGALTTLDEAEVLAKAREWAAKIKP
jgi:hypothetical protein